MWMIGDIHGCFAELEELLGQIPADDPLVFLGDYIDRGEDPFRVVERLLREKERSVFLMGNHEEMFLTFFLNPQQPGSNAWILPANGSEQTLRSYKLNRSSSFEEFPRTHRDFFTSLRLYYETESFIAVHAGLRITGSHDLSLQEKEDLLWIRHEWISNESKWTGKHVYYGHTPSLFVLRNGASCKPIYGKNSTGIDTGCYLHGCLTAIHSDSHRLIQVKKK